MRATTIALVITIALLALPAHASGPRLAPADTDCPDKVDAPVKPIPRARGTTATRDSGKAKPTGHGDSGEPQRLQSPRWHSFLPGMIR